MPNPMVTKVGIVDMQVCVPSDWADEEVENFANRENPTGLHSQWSIRKEGHEMLKGEPERVPCFNSKRKGFVHIMLSC